MDPKYTEEYFKEKLTPAQYKVLREGDTQPAFHPESRLLHNKEAGMYTCAACGAEIFSSETKFDSGSGWPSFYDIENEKSVELVTDNKFGMQRVEVKCANCGSHLGHVFPDGPQDKTGQRYCINDCALDFKPTVKEETTPA